MNAQYNCHDIYRRCKKKLKSMTFEDGKHIVGRYYINGAQKSWITIPKGRKPVTPGTYASMARQLKLNVAQFDDLLECPLSIKDYEKILLPEEPS